MSAPETIGPYRVRARLSKETSGERLFDAEDGSGARVWLHEIDATGPRARKLLETAQHAHRVSASVDDPRILRAFEPTYTRQWGRMASVVFAFEPFSCDHLRHHVPKDVPTLCEVFAQAAEGLEALHRAGWLHADLRPESIVLTRDGNAKLRHLGAARAKGEAAPVEGASDFSAPEQIAGRPLSERSDIYGLGAAMYWALTGWRPPSAAQTERSDTPVSAYQKPRHPCDARRDLPLALGDLVVQALEEQPADRPETMASVTARLRSAQRQARGEAPTAYEAAGAKAARAPAESPEASPAAGEAAEAPSPAAAARAVLLGAGSDEAEVVEAAADHWPEPGLAVERGDLEDGLAAADGAEPELALVRVDARADAEIRRLRELLEQHPRTPVIALCAGGAHAAAEGLLRAGAQECLPVEGLEAERLAQSMRHARARHACIAALRDQASELHDLNTRLRRVSEEDSLTGLGSRHGLARCLEREHEGAERGHALAAIYLEAAASGHAPRNRLERVQWIQSLAQPIRESLRRMDYAARLHGTEFLVVLRGANRAEARSVAERIHKRVGEAVAGSELFAAVFDLAEGADPPDGMLERGRRRVAEGKQRGHRLVLDWAAADPASRLPEDTLDALQRGEAITTLSQPIVGIRDGAPCGHELLARAGSARVRPDAFFGLCQQAGLLTAVDRQCFRRGLASAPRAGAPRRCHLNLFPDTLLEWGAEGVLGELPSGLGDGAVWLELPQHEILGGAVRIERPVAAVREAGVGVAIEGVAPGERTLESLIVLGPDAVKVPPKWVAGVAEFSAQRSAMERLVTHARRAGAKVIAVGVDEEADREALAELGVEEGQGLLWAEPSRAA